MMKRENKLIVAAVVLPLLVGAFFDQKSAYKLSIMHFLVLTTLMITFNGMLLLQRKDWQERKLALQCSGMFFFTICLIRCCCVLRGMEGDGGMLRIGLGVLLALVLAAFFLLLIKSEKGITENVVTLVIFAAFLVRIFYVVMTPAYLFQNDATDFYPDCYGHLGYVYQLFTYGRLPDVDPITAYQLYHPPFHYVVSVVFLKAFGLLGLLPQEQLDWDEILQVLPLIYTMVLLVYIDKIGKQMKLSCEARFTVICFAGFLPYSIMMSGALNNDPLSVLLAVMCVYYTFSWYENPHRKGIVKMALCIGFAMMTKISAALVVPAMAAVMLQRAWKGRKQWKDYLKQFICFGLAAFPLGMWHSVYCYVKWGMPFGYAYPVEPDAPSFIGMYDIRSRFLDFDRAFDFLAVSMYCTDRYADHNIPASLVKFATFGESAYYRTGRLTNILGPGMFWANMALFLLMAAAFVVWCFIKDGRGMQKAFLLAVASVSLYAYVKFCVKYTHICSMNIRYIMVSVYAGFIVIAAAAFGLQEKIFGKSAAGGRISKGILVTVPVLYALWAVVLKAGMAVLLP